MDDKNLYNEIASLAYELYEKSGRVEGRDLVNWHEAERIVMARYAAKENNQVNKYRNKEYIGQDRRRNKRLVVKDFQKGGYSSSKINILNISTEGVAVESTIKLQKNDKYALEIRHSGNSHRLKGRVVWAVLARIEKKDSGDIIAVYKAGMEFEQPLLGISSAA